MNIVTFASIQMLLARLCVPLAMTNSQDQGTTPLARPGLFCLGRPGLNAVLSSPYVRSSPKSQQQPNGVDLPGHEGCSHPGQVSEAFLPLLPSRGLTQIVPFKSAAVSGACRS